MEEKWRAKGEVEGGGKGGRSERKAGAMAEEDEDREQRRTRIENNGETAAVHFGQTASRDATALR
eukprot:976819-Pleurochrysis_carterae.AAC.1